MLPFLEKAGSIPGNRFAGFPFQKYDAADQAAINMAKIPLGLPDSEERLRSHPVVQRELGRQARDIELLQRGSVDAIKSIKLRAFSEHLLEHPET